MAHRDRRSPQNAASRRMSAVCAGWSASAWEMRSVSSRRTSVRPRIRSAKRSDSVAGMTVSSLPCSRKTGTPGSAERAGERPLSPRTRRHRVAKRAQDAVRCSGACDEAEPMERAPRRWHQKRQERNRSDGPDGDASKAHRSLAPRAQAICRLFRCAGTTTSTVRRS